MKPISPSQMNLGDVTRGAAACDAVLEQNRAFMHRHLARIGRLHDEETITTRAELAVGDDERGAA